MADRVVDTKEEMVVVLGDMKIYIYIYILYNYWDYIGIFGFILPLSPVLYWRGGGGKGGGGSRGAHCGTGWCC